MPTHVIADRLIINSTRSRVLVGACSGSFFLLNNNGREDLSGTLSSQLVRVKSRSS